MSTQSSPDLDVLNAPRPFPAGEVFGAALPFQLPAGDYELIGLYGQFDYEAGRWSFQMVVDIDFPEPVPEMIRWGDTPKEAFEKFLDLHKFMNGGVESKLIRTVRPYWDQFFNEDGSMREHIDSDDEPVGDYTPMEFSQGAFLRA